MERFNLTACVNIFLIKEGQICLLRRQNTGWHDGDYEVPAGHIDGGEPITLAAIREAKEEVGVDILPEHLHVVHVMHRKGGKGEKIEFFLTADTWVGTPSVQEVDKADDVAWFALDTLPENIIPKTKQAIEMYMKEVQFSEYGW